MKAERAYPKFIVSAKGTRWVEGGHPWVYAEEIVSEEGAAENGALADAVSEKGKYLGLFTVLNIVFLIFLYGAHMLLA